MAGRQRDGEMMMPADRLFHARLGHSAKVSSLSDLEYRVWTTYVLAADDFGLMRADAVPFQAAHDALSGRPARAVQRSIERLVKAGLVGEFVHHQGSRYLYQPGRLAGLPAGAVSAADDAFGAGGGRGEREDAPRFAWWRSPAPDGLPCPVPGSLPRHLLGILSRRP